MLSSAYIYEDITSSSLRTRVLQLVGIRSIDITPDSYDTIQDSLDTWKTISLGLNSSNQDSVLEEAESSEKSD